MSFPVNDIPYGSTRWLHSQVGGFLDFGFHEGDWDHTKFGKIKSIVDAGEMQYYEPPPVEGGEGHVWSFLRPTLSMTLASGTKTYDLPLGVSSVVDGFTAEESVGADEPAGVDRVVLAKESTIRQLHKNDPKSGFPVYYAIRAKKGDNTQEQGYEVVFWPIPDKAIDLSYTAVVTPMPSSSSGDWPLGGRQHSEGILQSCLAVAEQRETKQEGTATARFMQRLAAAVKLDIQYKTASNVFPSETIEYGSLKWLMSQVGGWLDYGFDESEWDKTTRGKLKSIVDAGELQFYNPQPLAEEGKAASRPHKWSWLEPTLTLPIESGVDTYELPLGVFRVDGGFVAEGTISRDSITDSTDTRKIEIANESEIRQLQTSDPKSGFPRYAALRPKAGSSVEQLYEVTFWPKPDASMDLSYKAYLTPLPSSSRDGWPLGGRQHAETILQSCLAIAETRNGNVEGPATSKYLHRLAASIQLDMQVAEEASVWPIEALPQDFSVTRNYLRKIVSIYLGLSPHPQTWTHQQLNEINLYVHQGLMKFYNPPLLDGQRYPHHWTFLNPVGTLTTVASTYIYDLPADLAMIEGPLTYSPGTGVLYPPLKFVREETIRQELSRTTSASRPLYFAIRQDEMDAGKGTRYELILAPVPDGAYVYNYRYKTSPAMIPDDVSFPFGGPPHSRTIIEACLCVAEEYTGLTKGLHSGNFMQALAASIGHDQDAGAAEGLGILRDMEGEEFDRFASARQFDNNAVPYEGAYYYD